MALGTSAGPTRNDADAIDAEVEAGDVHAGARGEAPNGRLISTITITKDIRGSCIGPWLAIIRASARCKYFNRIRKGPDT
jgi:hypothetical protein